ncbi:NAD(P)/FAD-dependent oxidoreductase [Candidatus Woesearchaeota archaeon]|nr:NAD(P)/FAD-dependent oxidoreductase [Candidatus Woesearchaeota archaeon]
MPDTINIIGAGPAGGYSAYLLAKEGYKVNLFEENSGIGRPVQCTGIVTGAFADIMDVKDEFLINKVDTARIHAPNGNSVDFRLDRENLVICRTSFDRYVAAMASEAGAEVLHSHKLEALDERELGIRDGSRELRKFPRGILIGADGPNSAVARLTGISGKRRFWYGAQATIRGKFEKNVFEVYLGSIATNFFAWSVPENEHYSRIGLAVESEPNAHFRKLLVKLGIKESDVADYQGGLIPMYNPSVRTQIGSTYLVGDAALQVKATTGGGIIQGLIAAEALAHSIKNGVDYEKEWRKRLGRDLYTSYWIRKVFNKFTDNDYNMLLSIVGKERIRKLIEHHDREFPSKLLLSLLFREPRFLYFAKALF